ncbi:hypothetical protein PTI45_00836 [Paenibacillus nuruki]|uniref:DAC domain-containing protein n=2 Tax=Paenibacillus nuruki TaxID=1886670 RepID=A0A1E3L778_9BACL|nr:hypothetical protein PTI45_00836 [Paenibacillus nuruki]
MNKELIIESDLIRFAIRFAKHDVIKLEDAKRIRKLLELTNIEKDLYLIADHNVIYGIGEVNWHLQKDFLILRLDFHGVSKYILSFAKLKMQSILEGQLITKENQKFYRSDLKLEEKELISITFKNPKINEEGYSIERFSRILSKELFENKEEQIKIEKLNEIVQKARMQKHGTIVVFTNFETAKNEIKKLSKQSTVIEVGPINPEHIEFLTSIDGAIYFDSDCNCHGIGVILDGEAQENIGDASRGARFNSAYRYIAKLKKSGQKCVIIIISEDGMIDVLPEFEDEDKLLEITEEIIDLIKEGKENNEEMTEKELKLLGSSLVDNEWLFKIAQTYYDLNNYKKANKYYTRAIELGEKVFIDADYYFNASINAYLLAYTEESSDIYIYSTKLAFEFITKLNEEENKCYGYYILALCYIEITKLKMKNRNKQEELVNDLKQTLFFAEKVLENPKKINNENSSAVYKKIGDIYYKLINIEKLEDEYFLTEALKCYSISIQLYENYFNYYAQGLTYKKLKNIKKALKSFITSAFFKESEEHFKAILDEVDLILKKNNKVIKAARSFYDECANSKFKIQKLDTLILDYENKE